MFFDSVSGNLTCREEKVSVYFFFKNTIPLVLYLSSVSGVKDMKASCYFSTFFQDGAAD